MMYEYILNFEENIRKHSIENKAKTVYRGRVEGKNVLAHTSPANCQEIKLYAAKD